ncbi:MAG: T9SS type A sorting domain-containing protein [Leeuwenhoekiella sp.]
MQQNYTYYKLYLLFFTLVFFIGCNQKTEQKFKPIKAHSFLGEDEHEEEKDPDHKKGIEEIADYIASIMKPIGADSSSYKAGYLMKEYERVSKFDFKKTSTKGITQGATKEATVTSWTERGPANVPGRTRTVVVSPVNPDKWYAGTVGGGLWITSDGGTTWSNATDYKIPNLSTSTIAISAASPKTIYLGTGEPFGNLDELGGTGVMKSIDDGNTWAYLENTKTFGGIGRLAINPNDANHLIVASEKGVYLTLDGGASWQKPFSSSTAVQDINATPGNFNIMYAAVNSVGLFKSIDGGLNWSIIFKKSDYNRAHERFEIDVSPVNPNELIVGVFTPFSANTEATTAVNTDFYVSTDAGKTFSILDYTGNDSEANLLSGQGWYDNIITAHPYKENVFYAGGVVMYKVTINPTTSTFTFDPIAAGYDGEINDEVHVDQHGLTWIKGNNNNFKLILSNDGGVYSTSYLADPGTTEGDWSGIAIGLNSTQFYGADKNNGTDNYIAGAQDNGTYISLNGGSDSKNTIYSQIVGGDGFEVIWNYNDPTKYIGGAQNNNFLRYSNGQYYDATFEESGNYSPFYSKIANANNNPEVLFSPSLSGVWKSSNFAESWKLTEIPEKFAYVTSNGVSSSLDVAVSVANPDIVWAGSAMYENGTFTMLVSTDNGNSYAPTNTFTDPRGGDFTHDNFISALETSPTNENRAYVLFSGQGVAKVLRTNNLGLEWEDISGFSTSENRNFPDVAVHSIVEMPFDENIIWVGTDIGIVETIDAGLTWHLLEGFPAISVWQMKIVNDQVVLATHGRGVWTATLTELNGYEPPAYFGPPSIVETYQEAIDSQNGVVVYNLVSDGVTSVKIFVDGVEVDEVVQGFNTETNYSYKINDLPEGLHNIELQALNTKGKVSQKSQMELGVVNYDAPAELVSLKNIQNQDIFTFNGEFEINDVGGDVSMAVLNNRNHPYINSTTYRAILKKPIIITTQSSDFTYEDVAIVEPGDSGGFYDFVVVEASTDLRNWTQLDMYDARKFPDWLSTFDNEKGINDGLFKSQLLDLINAGFQINDEVVIRFKLVADQSVTGFGWAIRSINKDKELAIAQKEMVSSAISIYPTISDGELKISSNIPINDALIEVFDLSGKSVYKNKSDLIEKGQNVSLTTLSSGLYIVRISADTKLVVKKIIIK